MNVATTHHYLHNHADAMPYRDLAIDLAPDEVGHYRAKAGAILLRDGDVTAAEQVLQRAAERFGVPAVLSALVSIPIQRWFGLPGFVFSQALKEMTVSALGGGPADYYHACAVLEQTEGDTVQARAYFDSLRVSLEYAASTTSDTLPWLHSALGIAYAGVGRKNDAIREALSGVEQMPVSQDAFSWSDQMYWLAVTYIMVGEYDLAIDQLETLLSVPSPLSKSVLRIYPLFDNLRNNPRFQRLLEGGN